MDQDGLAEGGDGTGIRPAKKGKGGRLARRSPAEIARTLEAVVVLLRKSKEGLRSGQIRQALKLDVLKGPWRVLREGFAKKKLKSKGAEARDDVPGGVEQPWLPTA